MSLESQVDRANRYFYDIMPCGGKMVDFADKERLNGQHIRYMLNRTQSMFKWDGLPESIPARMLELYLQANGNACFYKHNGELYVFTGGMGGVPDMYYRPTIYTISNSALNLSVNAKIGEDCVVMPNDSMYQGLIPLFARYATMITETELSLSIAAINARFYNIFGAADDNAYESAQQFIEDIKAGKLGIITEKSVFDEITGLKVHPAASDSGAITNLIELLQYAKASWFNNIGLNANYNMKRESLNTTESQMNNDALLPLVDDMLNCRQLYAEKVNEMFGTQISVDFASSWEDNEIEIELEHDEMTKEEPEQGVENNDDKTADQ